MWLIGEDVFTETPFSQCPRHEFESGGGARLAKVGGQGFPPFTSALKLLASQKVGGHGQSPRSRWRGPFFCINAEPHPSNSAPSTGKYKKT